MADPIICTITDCENISEAGTYPAVCASHAAILAPSWPLDPRKVLAWVRAERERFCGDSDATDMERCPGCGAYVVSSCACPECVVGKEHESSSDSGDDSNDSSV